MLAILFTLAQAVSAMAPSMTVASNTRVQGLQVVAPADRGLLSRTVYSDGTIGECRRTAEEKPGWLNLECRAGIFLGQGVYEPVRADPGRRAALEPYLAIDAPPLMRALH